MATANKTGLPTALEARHKGTIKLATFEAGSPRGADYSGLRYDYEQVDPEHRQQVMEAALEILEQGKRAKDSIVVMGQRLIEVKAVLPHGQFGEWLRTEFDLSDRMARNFMNVAREFGGKTEIISVLGDTVLYLLAAPDVPESAREQIEAKALIDGRSPKVDDVKAMIAQHRGVVDAEPEEEGFVTVEALRKSVSAWLVTVSKDLDTQTYYLESIHGGRRDELHNQLVGYLRRVCQIFGYRDDDLAEAITVELAERRQRRIEKEAKRGPEPPSEWKVREAIEAWLKGKALKPDSQYDLITDLRDREGKHSDYAEMTATLPLHWRRRELNRALSSLADSLSLKVGADDWEAIQLASGRWYARNKARNPASTTIFDTQQEALMAVERANDSNSRLYGRLETVVNNPTEFWGIDEFFRDAPADVIAEAKLGLDKLAAQPDAPPHVAQRLKRIEERMKAAQHLLQITSVPPAPTNLLTPPDLTEAGYEIILAAHNGSYRWINSDGELGDWWTLEAAIADARKRIELAPPSLTPLEQAIVEATDGEQPDPIVAQLTDPATPIHTTDRNSLHWAVGAATNEQLLEALQRMPDSIRGSRTPVLEFALRKRGVAVQKDPHAPASPNVDRLARAIAFRALLLEMEADKDDYFSDELKRLRDPLKQLINKLERRMR